MTSRSGGDDAGALITMGLDQLASEFADVIEGDDDDLEWRPVLEVKGWEILPLREGVAGVVCTHAGDKVTLQVRPIRGADGL